VSRATGAAQTFGNQRHADACLLLHAVRVDFLDIRGEQQVTTCADQLFLIGDQGAWVFVEVFVGAELQRVDEDAGDHEISALGGFFHESDVPGVQVAHGGYQGDTLALAAGTADGGAQFAQALDGDHAENPCSAAGNSAALTART